MQNGTKYTWTISIIAIYNENEPPLTKAYKEFEDSIQAVHNASENLRFSIFFYDSWNKKAVIKESEIMNGSFRLKEVANLGEVNIYEEDHTELKRFFAEHVAKKAREENEEHKHMLITWGHGAGLGFMKEEIKKQLSMILKMDKSDEEKAAKETAAAIRLMNDLALDIKAPGYIDVMESLVDKILLYDKSLDLKEEKREKILSLFKIISL